MILNTFRSEFTKLRSTKALWVTSALTLIFSWLFAGLMASLSEGPILDSVINSGLSVFGFATILIQAIMVVTTEYRYKAQIPLYLANNNRLRVAVVKLVLYAVIAAVLTFIALVGVVIAVKVLASGPYADAYEPWANDIGRRTFWIYPVAAMMIVLFAQGMGLLVRQTAGAVAISLLLFMNIDALVTFIPNWGDKIAVYSPFGALQAWIGDISMEAAPWEGSTMFFFVFLIWGLVLWILGVTLLIKRDA